MQVLLSLILLHGTLIYYICTAWYEKGKQSKFHVLFNDFKIFIETSCRDIFITMYYVLRKRWKSKVIPLQAQYGPEGG